MSRISYCLHTIAVGFPMMVLFGISPASLARETIPPPPPWDKTKPPWVGTMLTGGACTGDQQPFGPYDYRQRNKFDMELHAVESFHFTPNVENMTGGVGSSYLDDVDYTLLTWPNHHRALHSVLRYRLEHRGPWPPDSQGSPAECYLQRAINFSPNDPIPYMLHGILLHQFKQYDKALTSYRKASRLLPDDMITQYNMGLTLVALKKYKEAEQVAKTVYSTGFPLQALKNQLAAAGHWQAEPRVASPKLTESQLAELKKAMREEAARKRAKADDVPLQTPAEGESIPIGDERIDPTIVSQ